VEEAAGEADEAGPVIAPQAAPRTGVEAPTARAAPKPA
jgi:hypothetical protein